MTPFIHPVLLFALAVVGGGCVCLALPRGGRWPQVLGALGAGLVGGVLLLALGLRAGEHRPNVYFYVFALILLGAALRVITHPRPVYAALYFVLTVIASAGLFVILSAEFMAFALIIVYAGAILITYLFVIMLATQAPDEAQTEVLAVYDTESREPLAASVVGFLLLAVLTSLFFRGAPSLPPPSGQGAQGLLAQMPRKIERTLRGQGLLREGEQVAMDAADERAVLDAQGRIVVGSEARGVRAIPPGEAGEGLEVSNVERVGFNLLRDHPGTIEIAGVILLMAMLGAVVLSRKQAQIDEDEKREMARRLGAGPGARRLGEEGA